MPLPTRPQRYCDPASLVYTHFSLCWLVLVTLKRAFIDKSNYCVDGIRMHLLDIYSESTLKKHRSLTNKATDPELNILKESRQLIRFKRRTIWSVCTSIYSSKEHRCLTNIATEPALNILKEFRQHINFKRITIWSVCGCICSSKEQRSFTVDAEYKARPDFFANPVTGPNQMNDFRCFIQ